MRLYHYDIYIVFPVLWESQCLRIIIACAPNREEEPRCGDSRGRKVLNLRRIWRGWIKGEVVVFFNLISIHLLIFKSSSPLLQIIEEGWIETRLEKKQKFPLNCFLRLLGVLFCRTNSRSSIGPFTLAQHRHSPSYPLSTTGGVTGVTVPGYPYLT